MSYLPVKAISFQNSKSIHDLLENLSLTLQPLHASTKDAFQSFKERHVSKGVQLIILNYHVILDLLDLLD